MEKNAVTADPQFFSNSKFVLFIYFLSILDILMAKIDCSFMLDWDWLDEDLNSASKLD